MQRVDELQLHCALYKMMVQVRYNSTTTPLPLGTGSTYKQFRSGCIHNLLLLYKQLIRHCWLTCGPNDVQYKGSLCMQLISGPQQHAVSTHMGDPYVEYTWIMSNGQAVLLGSITHSSLYIPSTYIRKIDMQGTSNVHNDGVG
jgi:hypothetical protein